MITGFYVGLEGPSWVGAMMALANVAEDKVALCARHDVDIAETDWPCRAMPDTLVGDRGEIGSTRTDMLTRILGVHVENIAPYRPDWKSIVENRFKLIPAQFKAYVPGYVDTDFQDRGAKDYRLDAKLDLDELTRIILHCILYYNGTHVFKDYPRQPGMIADKVPPIPIELWEWGMLRRSGALRAFPHELVKLALLPTEDAKVTAQGIRLFGCFYSCARAIEHHWFERARQQGNWTIKASYDPRCMTEIYVHDGEGESRFLACILTDSNRDYRDKSVWEIDQMRKEGRKQIKSTRSSQLQGRVNLTDTICSIVAEAEQKTGDQITDSNKARTKGIRDNRAVEKEARRRDEAFNASKTRPHPPATIVPFPGAGGEDYSEPGILEILDHLKGGGDDDHQ